MKYIGTFQGFHPSDSERFQIRGKHDKLTVPSPGTSPPNPHQTPMHPTNPSPLKFNDSYKVKWSFPEGALLWKIHNVVFQSIACINSKQRSKALEDSGRPAPGGPMPSVFPLRNLTLNLAWQNSQRLLNSSKATDGKQIIDHTCV